MDRYTAPAVAGEGYLVEFFEMTGNTVTVALFEASALRAPTPASRPAVGVLTA
jgi:hypothetical protein